MLLADAITASDSSTPGRLTATGNVVESDATVDRGLKGGARADNETAPVEVTAVTGPAFALNP